MKKQNKEETYVHFKWKKLTKKKPISYEKQCIKVYLNDDKTHADPWPHNDILWELKAHCAKHEDNSRGMISSITD